MIFRQKLLQMDFWLFLEVCLSRKYRLNTTVNHLLYVWVARPPRIESQQLAVGGWRLLGRLLNLFLSFPKGFKSNVNAPGFPGTQRSCLTLVYGSTYKPCERKVKSKSQGGTKPCEAKGQVPGERNSRVLLSREYNSWSKCCRRQQAEGNPVGRHTIPFTGQDLWQMLDALMVISLPSGSAPSKLPPAHPGTPFISPFLFPFLTWSYSFSLLLYHKP